MTSIAVLYDVPFVAAFRLARVRVCRRFRPGRPNLRGCRRCRGLGHRWLLEIPRSAIANACLECTRRRVHVTKIRIPCGKVVEIDAVNIGSESAAAIPRCPIHIYLIVVTIEVVYAIVLSASRGGQGRASAVRRCSSIRQASKGNACERGRWVNRYGHVAWAPRVRINYSLVRDLDADRV